MNYVLCNLNLCINLLYLLCLNKLDVILCLFIVKKKKLEDKFIFYIYFGDYMVYGVYFIILV